MEETTNKDQQRNRLLSYLTHLEKLMQEKKSGEKDTGRTQTIEGGDEVG